jgi:hypothetical protein
MSEPYTLGDARRFLLDQSARTALLEVLSVWRRMDEQNERGYGDTTDTLEGHEIAEARRLHDGLETALIFALERLSIICSELSPHRNPSLNHLEPQDYVLTRMEGGAWAVSYCGNQLVIRPDVEHKEWICTTMQKAGVPKEGFRTLHGGLAWATRKLKEMSK